MIYHVHRCGQLVIETDYCFLCVCSLLRWLRIAGACSVRRNCGEGNLRPSDMSRQIFRSSNSGNSAKSFLSCQVLICAGMIFMTGCSWQCSHKFMYNLSSSRSFQRHSTAAQLICLCVLADHRDRQWGRQPGQIVSRSWVNCRSSSKTGGPQIGASGSFTKTKKNQLLS